LLRPNYKSIWCTGLSDQNLSVGQILELSAVEVWTDQRRHIYDCNPDVFCCSANTSSSQTVPTNFQDDDGGIPSVDLVVLTWIAAKDAAGYNVYRNNQYLITVTNSSYTDKGLNGRYKY